MHQSLFVRASPLPSNDRLATKRGSPGRRICARLFFGRSASLTKRGARDPFPLTAAVSVRRSPVHQQSYNELMPQQRLRSFSICVILSIALKLEADDSVVDTQWLLTIIGLVPSEDSLPNIQNEFAQVF